MEGFQNENLGNWKADIDSLVLNSEQALSFLLPDFQGHKKFNILSKSIN
jgi:hypothetical protein